MSPRLREAVRWLFLLAVLLACVSIRFDLRDPGPIRRLTAGATATAYGLPLDVAGYVRLTGWFRGHVPADSLIAPFCYRPLVPLLASALPWNPLTSIDLVDVACLVATLLLLDRLLFAAGYGTRARTVGGLLFAASFPTFYYGAIGFLDPAALLAVTAMALAALQARRLLFAAWLVMGVLIKETNAVFALLPALEAWSRGAPSRVAVRRGIAAAALALAVAIGIRLFAPFPERGSLWMPRLAFLTENLARPRAFVSLALTLGLPAAGAVAALATGRAALALGPERVRYFVGGAGLAALLYVLSLVSAYADGRVIWSAYPFLIPLAAALVEPRAATRRLEPARAAAR